MMNDVDVLELGRENYEFVKWEMIDSWMEIAGDWWLTVELIAWNSEIERWCAWSSEIEIEEVKVEIVLDW